MLIVVIRAGLLFCVLRILSTDCYFSEQWAVAGEGGGGGTFRSHPLPEITEGTNIYSIFQPGPDVPLRGAERYVGPFLAFPRNLGQIPCTPPSPCATANVSAISLRCDSYADCHYAGCSYSTLTAFPPSLSPWSAVSGLTQLVSSPLPRLVTQPVTHLVASATPATMTVLGQSKVSQGVTSAPGGMGWRGGGGCWSGWDCVLV